MTDSRTAKAFRLWQANSLWIVLLNAAGIPEAYGIPSESQPGVIYRVTDQSCECRDSQRGNVCKHQRAVVMRIQEVKNGHFLSMVT